jgi:tetratricopeptide (TPR) repeat protein
MMISKGIPGLIVLLIAAGGSVAAAQEATDEAPPVDEAGILDQVVPVADQDAAAETDPVAEDPGPPQSYGLSAEDELLQHFATYKRLMNDGVYDEADSVAKRIVTLAIEVTGPRSSETAKALTNLGIVQHRNKQFDAAQQNFMTAIDIIEDIEDRLNGRLVNPLKGLGASQLEGGRPDLAAQTFDRAIHITHVNEGPHNVSQIEILESLAETSLRLGSVEEAREMHDKIYMLHQRRYEDDQLSLVPTLMRRAEWQHRAGYIVDEQATYRRTIRIIEQNAGKKDLLLIEPLTRLGQSYFYTDLHGEQGLHHNPVTGEIYFKRALRIAESHPESNWRIETAARVSLGDYYMMQDMHSRARKIYGQVWESLSDDEEKLTARHNLFADAVPLDDKALPEFIGDSQPPTMVGLSQDYEQGTITMKYTVTNRGRIIGLALVEVYPPEFTDMHRTVHRELRSRTYRPRYADGEPMIAEDQVFTHSFYYKEADLEQRRAEKAGAEST